MLDNIVFDVLYPCTCEITRAGRGHAESYANAFGTRIHFSHDLDLTVALCDVCLIDANRVDPYIARLMSMTQIAKSIMQIKRDEKVLM
jgi:hypothetical protein